MWYASAKQNKCTDKEHCRFFLVYKISERLLALTKCSQTNNQIVK